MQKVGKSPGNPPRKTLDMSILYFKNFLGFLMGFCEEKTFCKPCRQNAYIDDQNGINIPQNTELFA